MRSLRGRESAPLLAIPAGCRAIRGRNFCPGCRLPDRAMTLGDFIMEKKIAGLLGAVAALSTLNAAQAAPALAPAPLDVLHANGYADLLEPIPNAVALLKQVDDQTPAPSAKAAMQVAQAHHHHHHHHDYL